MKKRICIIGTGGFAKEVLWLIHDLGRLDEVACFMEPDADWREREMLGVPVWPQSRFDPTAHTATIAIGSSKIREKVVGQLPAETEYESLIHPAANLAPWLEIGEGCIICAQSIVTADVKIGKQVHLNCMTSVGHDCIIGDYTTTTAAVNISGSCVIGKHTYWGNGSTIRQGLSVCDEVIIGMGAVVTKNIEESGVYVGMPAKKMK